ncbi:MAG TPA: carboxylesterase/lipase family protein [Caulobacteraceae bacterium]|jgi:para-nitrobenzyl esterase
MHRRQTGLKTAALGLALAALAVGPALAAAPVAQTEAGAVSGAVEDGVNVFKGVPFAQPPVGPLRWRPAQAAKPWTGVLQATRFGPACLQKTKLTAAEKEAEGAAPEQVSEDCLTLNVWAPAAKADHPLPVMVWLHGGGHVAGTGALPYYDGTSFAQDGVILVTINYRLGYLGYFAHPALTREAASDAPLGDYGTTDQLAALRWVQRNIAAFGGDPANVTLFGESAGGMSTLAILSAPSAKGLFAKAIIESGLGWDKHRSLGQAETEGAAAADKLGLAGASATAEQLRAASGQALVGAAEGQEPGLIVDGRLLPQSPVAALAKGEIAHVPMIIGTNSNEGSLIAHSPPAKILSEATPQVLAAGKTYYGPAAPDDAALARKLWRDATFTAPARWVAAQASAGQPVWLYHFDYQLERWRKDHDGVSHGFEIPFVFGSWGHIFGSGLILTAADRAESATVHSCWASFAKTGTPTCVGAPAWPAYTAASDSLMDFGPANTVKAHFDKAILDVIETTVKSSGRLTNGQ